MTKEQRISELISFRDSLTSTKGSLPTTMDLVKLLDVLIDTIKRMPAAAYVGDAS